MSSQACTSSLWWMVRFSRLGRSLVSLAKDQFKLDELKKFKVAEVLESGVLHMEDSYDQLLFKDHVRKFLLQQRLQVTFESWESDSRVSHSPDSLSGFFRSWSWEQFVQPSEPLVQIKEYLDLPGRSQPTEHQARIWITGLATPFRLPKSIWTHHSSKESCWSMDTLVKSDPSEEDHRSTVASRSKVPRRISKDTQRRKSDEVIKKELISLSSVGHEVYAPVTLNLTIIDSSEDQVKIIESRWVIGPRSGQLKARFVGKGHTQIIDKESKYAHTPQATTLKIILLMSQIHRWSLWVSDVASAFLNTPIDGSKGFILVQESAESQYPEPTVWRLKRQLYDLRDSLRSRQVHLNQVLKNLNLSQMKSDLCTGIQQVISISWSWLTSMTSW